MITPVLNALTELAPLIDHALKSAETRGKAEAEKHLQDILNAQFGHTQGTVETLSSVSRGLRSRRKTSSTK